MKKILFVILILILPFIIVAQQYGNEWINYNQTYFKIPVTKEGIYRIPQSVLTNSGFLNGLNDTRNIQLFYRGQEQYIYIYGESNGTLTSNGYIEFYAKGNDGWLDSLLYEPPTDITNPYYSLYTDTAYYFLTYNSSLLNKRITLETDTDFTNPTYQTVPNCVVDVLYQNPQYYYGAENGPRYLKGEGWFDMYFNLGQTVTKTLSTPGFVSGIKPAKINVSIATNSHYGHHLNVTLNSTQIFDTTFYGLTSVKKTYITTSSLSPTTSITFSCINDLNVSTDYIEIAYITLTYARDFAFNGLFKQNFRIKDSNGNKTLLQIEQFLHNNAVLWDLTNHKRIPVVEQNSKLNAIVPNSDNEKECFIIAEDSVKYVSKLEKRTFVNYLPTGINTTDYVIITNPLLWTGATAYKDYRNNNNYNKYNANCYDVEQLYDQFSYGIKKHPLAIKNFLKYISTPLNSADSLPKFVFLIGKGIHSGTWSYSESFRKNTANFAAALVPSYGSPSSDNMLTTKILTNNFTQDIPIGRIAATDNNEVNIYLSKVREHESDSATEWMKRVIHFGGGNTTAQQNTFAGYLSDYEAIISDTLFGGNVNTFLKTTSLPIQITVADTVRNLINDGTSLITFFGHGYADGFDQNIEEPDAYNNQRKYPLLIANSCLTGDIHLPAPKKISERWIFEPEKGAIAFLATVDLGYDSYLNIFTTELYKQFAYKDYMQPIGKCIRDGNVKLYNDYNSSILNTCLEFTLHGDPAVSLKCFPLPDLTINDNSISFVPQIVSSAIDYFYVKTIVTNIGKAINNTFAINITRTYPDGSIDYYSKFVNGCHFKDTVLTKIPVNFIKGTGINSFCVKVDALDSIHESREDNNIACTSITIRSNDLMPIYPYEYAIFPNNTVTLKASTGYPFIGIQTYKFEIDTTDLFSTLPLVSGTVTQAGGVVTWQPPITLTNNSVYFWRVSPAQNSQNYNWKESSFIYISGKTGWSQAHFFQYKKDGFESINYNRTTRTFDFVNAPKTLHVHDIGSANNDEEYNETGFFIDADNDRTSCGAAPAILAVVIDPTTLIPWQCNKGNYGQENYPICPTHNGYNKYFVFYATADLSSLATFINNVIPNGFYFLAYTFISGNLQQWPQITYQAFENLSSHSLHLTSLGNNIPYVFFCKKGDLSSVKEIYGATPNDTVDTSITLPTNFTSGKVVSTLIGPARAWQTLNWLQSSMENPTTDSVHLEVKAYKPNNDSTIAIPFLSTSQYNINNLYNYVNVSTYPYLRLNLLTKDDSLKTPSQLKRWQVTYDEAPETAINPTKGYYCPKDTLQEGDIMKFGVATENVSRYDMDSLKVRYWLQDRNNHLVNLAHAYRKLRKHPAGDVLMDTIKFSTVGLAGLNNIWYEVNPIDTITGKYAQLEQYHFNNFAEKPFFVLSDRTNPLLDVTFDGVHILNGDIVSAKPNILVTLKDENKFLALNNTSLFGVYLKDLTTGIEKKINFDSSQVELHFTPAQLPKNSCKIEYHPILADGKYQLRIQAKDESNNESGDSDYRIDFEVINKATITNIYNYPNPFSSSTRFVFTLTGSEIPDNFRIQIFTITGKFVREIGLNELGNVHIGNNITQFAWDGTDMYGDKLANGVYFFKVIARLNNETIEHRATDADKFFKQGVGKMYILR